VIADYGGKDVEKASFEPGMLMIRCTAGCVILCTFSYIQIVTVLLCLRL